MVIRVSRLAIEASAELHREGDLFDGAPFTFDHHHLASQSDLAGIVNAADVMRPPISLRKGEDLRVALERMLAQGVRELPAIDVQGRIIGFVDETSIAHAHVAARDKLP